MTEQIIKRLQTHQQLLIEFANANDINNKAAICERLNVLTFMHLCLTADALLKHNAVALIDRLIDIEHQLYNQHGNEPISVLKNVATSINLALMGKRQWHDKLYTFVNKICRATYQPIKHEWSKNLKCKYEIIVAQNRLWVNFFDKYAARFEMHTNGTVALFIDGLTGQGSYFEADSMQSLQSTVKFTSAASSFIIAQTLLNNATFIELVKEWSFFTHKIDAIRQQYKYVYAALIKLQSMLFDDLIETSITHRDDVCFSISTTYTVSSNIIKESIHTVKNKQFIGAINHKLWPSKDALMHPLSIFLFNADYPITLFNEQA